jgi:hypothetical protein
MELLTKNRNNHSRIYRGLNPKHHIPLLSHLSKVNISLVGVSYDISFEIRKELVIVISLETTKKIKNITGGTISSKTFIDRKLFLARSRIFASLHLKKFVRTTAPINALYIITPGSFVRTNTVPKKMNKI